MKLIRFLPAVALTALITGTASAQSTTAQATVTYSVTDTKSIAVSGDPGAMSVSAGGSGATATENTTTYDVTTNAAPASPAKITAQLGSAMPTGVTLSVDLADPDGAGAATSAGSVALSDAAATDVVTNISNLDAPGNTITYSLAATAAASAASNNTVVVTYTIQ
ncbi:MAG TPA: hypothetical protein VFS44_13680 [Gemmatimonadaceae bacterium]|nr:hypothetical protein [Gemmatimonadaceae bacterium]